MHQWQKTDLNHYWQIFCLLFITLLFSIASPTFASTSGSNDFKLSTKTRGVAVLAFDSGSGQKKEVRLYNKTYAVIIGIDQYINLPLDRQLTYAVRDAKGVAQTLERNFKFNTLITLYNKEATRDRILEVLTEQLPREMTREDSLFVFWAGHGNQEKGRYGDLGYLIPYDGSLTKIRKNITMAEIRDTISKKIPAKHIFYVMDACYGGLLAQTRGVDKQTKRDFHYLQEMTSEPAIQVLTAGGKDQEVLDGGPRGHSVFTGRLIEVLENAQDFITANELQAFVKEKVFSDARARNHEQTPSFGELFGTGDYVFVPSVERKVDDTRSKVAALQKEMERLKMIEAAAAQAKDERARRMAELDKLALQAKLKAEQLKQQALEEERQKRQLAEKEQKRREAELSRQKNENENRLTALKLEVAEKRKKLGVTTLSALSPVTTITEMHEIDQKIKDIKASFHQELRRGINAIIKRVNLKFEKTTGSKKDEFESKEEFKVRVEKEKNEAGIEQTGEITKLEKKIEREYNQQIVPFIEQLKKLSGNEFTLTADNLIFELHKYHAKSNTYPVTIKSKQPINGINVASTAWIPIPKQEARIFKQHFHNNMLRPEITGNFQSLDFFRVAQAYVIDDATNKKYDLFSSKFVDLGNGIVYDSETKLLWLKDTNFLKREIECDLQRYKKKAVLLVESIKIAGLSGWRLPKDSELIRMKSVYNGLEPHPFTGISRNYHTSDTNGYGNCWCVDIRDGSFAHYQRSGYIWPVRGNK